MKTSFWNQLALPIIGLSPMDGVTDHPYRHIQKKYGQPGIIYTEFTNVEGVCHGAVRLLEDFLFDETQRPIVAQIYGTTPKYFRQVAVVLCELGFDGIDINMGCPAKSVDSSGAGAALIKTPQLAQEIIKAVQQGVSDYENGVTAKDCPDISNEIAQKVAQRNEKLPEKYRLEETLAQSRVIPVSVKTRIGYSEPVVEQWIPTLLELKPSAIALHGRTLKQQYSGTANWDEIHKAALLCKSAGTVILGNGDIADYDDALEKIKTYEVDGVLIGRSSFGNPFIFQKNAPELLAQHNIFEIALEHCRLFEATYGDDPRYHFMPMRKHLGWYVRGIEHAREVRIEVFQANNTDEVEAIFKKHNLI